MRKHLREMTRQVRQGVGKVRRLTYGRLRRKGLLRKLGRRRGDCLRCGACCKLLFKCPMLIEHADGSTACRIHRHRPDNCRIFPLDERDLHERDIQMPLLPCGFTFSDQPLDEAEDAEHQGEGLTDREENLHVG